MTTKGAAGAGWRALRAGAGGRGGSRPGVAGVAGGYGGQGGSGKCGGAAIALLALLRCALPNALSFASFPNDKNDPLFCGFSSSSLRKINISPGRKKVSRGKPTEKYPIFIMRRHT